MILVLLSLNGLSRDLGHSTKFLVPQTQSFNPPLPLYLWLDGERDRGIPDQVGHV